MFRIAARGRCAVKAFLFSIGLSVFLLPSYAGQWEKEIFLGFNLAGGNSDTVSGNVSFEARKNDRIDFEISSSYGKSESEKNLDRSSAAARYRWVFDRGIYAGLGLTGDRDSIAGVDYRYVASPVLGKKLVDSQKTKLTIEAGPGYLIESVSDEKNSGFVLKISEGFERGLNESSRLRQSFDFTVEPGGDYLIGFELGAVSALTARLNLRASALLKYDSSPAPERKKYDLGFTTSLGVRF